MTLKEIKGGAEELSLNAGINDSVTSFVTATTPTANWPTGTSPFVIVVGAGTANEEKMLVTTRSTSTFSGITRGYDGTVGVSHSAGAKVRHVIDAATVSEANAHVNTTTRDDHSQYLNTARHDVSARHTFGAALPTPAAPSDIGTAASAGAAAGPGRADHVHKLGAGAINSAGMFAAGVVDAAAIATDAVGTAEIATDAVGSAEIAALAVGTAEIAALAVTDAKVATANKDGTAGTASMRTLGTGAAQAAAGNDSRMVNAVLKDGTVAMTGALVLPGNAAAALEAVPKQQLDARVPLTASTWTATLQQNLQTLTKNFFSHGNEYFVMGPIVFFQFYVQVTQNASAGGQIKFTLPLAALSDGLVIGGVRITTAGVDKVGVLVVQDSSQWGAFTQGEGIAAPQLGNGFTIAAVGQYRYV